MIRIKNIFYIILAVSSIVNCNGKTKDNDIKISKNSKRDSITVINFLDQKYFTKYELDPNHEYPKFYYKNNEIGEFSVNYVAKGSKLQKSWANEEEIRHLQMGIETTKEEEVKISKIIKTKLETNLNNYYKIAEYVPSKYLVKNSYDYIYPYKKYYYLYNDHDSSWIFIKDKIVSDGSDERNLTKLVELNLMIDDKSSHSTDANLEYSTAKKQIELQKIEGIWLSDCKKQEYRKDVFITSTAMQFTISKRFSMNAKLKKVDLNKFEFYFIDFPPIIPLPNSMKNLEILDESKSVGYFVINDESKINLTWFGFYSKKSKNYFQTENPFNTERKTATLIRCKE